MSLYSLLSDNDLNQEDAEKDDCGTGDVVFEHRQVQGSVLHREHRQLNSWTTCSVQNIWFNV